MNYNDENLLEMVEMYAEEMGYISSEEELSQKFDEQEARGIVEDHMDEVGKFEDTVMMNEEFNNWADGLCKEGEIHREQSDSYAYVGEWS